ncbi:hypothetical protein [Actinomadura sp. 6N118]|uniref:hypothetical protein n=1 Tax=Actinomadura sp. 6N118 TaxID=3375151 RepID=UPI0037AD6BD7
MIVPLAVDTAILTDFQPPAVPPVTAIDALFAGQARYSVLTAAQAHETKKSSGSSDGAHTYDTLKT